MRSHAFLCGCLSSLLALASCSSEVPAEKRRLPPRVLWSENKQGTLTEFLPSLEEISTITITNETTLERGAAEVLPKENWPVLMRAFSKTRPVVVQQPLEETGFVEILTQKQIKWTVFLYDADDTGLVYIVFSQAQSTKPPNFGATGDRQVVLGLLPKSSQ